MKHAQENLFFQLAPIKGSHGHVGSLVICETALIVSMAKNY